MRNEVVPSERLLEELWGAASAARGNPLQVSVSRLRKALGSSDRVVTSPQGYMLRVDPEEFDRDLFQQLVADGSQLLEHEQPEAASSTLRRALGLWRGPPFVDFTYEPFAQAEIARLEEARLACLEERIEADLALGGHAQLVGELEALTREQPLRERPRGQLMLALYRSGRQADALEVYRETRDVFDRQLGIEPGPALRKLEAAILRQDDELDLPTAPITETTHAADVGPELPSPRPAVRKLVTVLVTGPAQSTAALDPELRKRLGDRAFSEVAPLLERHGATVERVRDGWAMGVFGIPAAFEDDALRAVRAAVELRDSFPDGAETVRTAIASGEVLTGDVDSREPLVTGSPVDVAIAFQQVSGGGEILVDETTRRLVGDAVRVEPLEPRDNESSAWRLLELVAGRSGFPAPFRRAADRPRC